MRPYTENKKKRVIAKSVLAVNPDSDYGAWLRLSTAAIGDISVEGVTTM